MGKLGVKRVRYALGSVDRIKYKAEELLKENDFTELFDMGSGIEVDETAAAALKVLLIENATEYAIKSIKFTKRRKKMRKVGAAAVLISAQKERW